MSGWGSYPLLIKSILILYSHFWFLVFLFLFLSCRLLDASCSEVQGVEAVNMLCQKICNVFNAVIQKRLHQFCVLLSNCEQCSKSDGNNIFRHFQR